MKTLEEKRRNSKDTIMRRVVDSIIASKASTMADILSQTKEYNPSVVASYVNRNSTTLPTGDPSARKFRKMVIESSVVFMENTNRTVKPRSKAGLGAGYKNICVTFYDEDLADLDRLVDELKAKGLEKTSRSSLIRKALKAFDPAPLETK
jgi:hypothetical protein